MFEEIPTDSVILQAKDGKFELRCTAQDKNVPADLPVRTIINRKGWNPFPDIAEYR